MSQKLQLSERDCDVGSLISQLISSEETQRQKLSRQSVAALAQVSGFNVIADQLPGPVEL